MKSDLADWNGLNFDKENSYFWKCESILDGSVSFLFMGINQGHDGLLEIFIHLPGINVMIEGRPPHVWIGRAVD